LRKINSTHVQLTPGPALATASGVTALDVEKARNPNLSIHEKFLRLEKAKVMVRKLFPGSHGSKYVLEKIIERLRTHHITPENTIYAESICPDEINHSLGNMTDIFADYFGEVFHMGGLAGIPFTGKTGFAALASHAPESKSEDCRVHFIVIILSVL
jgi:hypothetical protein